MIIHSKWITFKTGKGSGADDRYGDPAIYFRKTFTLKGEAEKVTFKIAALGVYKSYINGKEMSDDYLSPPWVDFTKKIPLVCYDITDKVKKNNAIGIIAGDGYAVGHVGSTATFKRNSYSDKVELSAEIEIINKNGECEIIPTDESWKASSGEILRSDIYMGEYVDRRLSLGNFSDFYYDDSNWSLSETDDFKFSKNIYVGKVDIPPIKVKHVFTPELISSGKNKFLYDVKQNIAGVLRVTVKGECGTRITMRHGEILNDGKLYVQNLRKAEATDSFILSGEAAEELRPLFTYHGFRYFELEIDGEAELLDVKAEAMYTDLDVSGKFSCSSELVNKIYSNVLWSQRDNFYSVPTDCPQRDERLGWLGDVQIFCQSAMYNMDCKKYYEKYLADIRDAQLGNGAIPCVAPLPHIGFKSYTGYDASAGWSEAIIIIPYLHYKMYGDRQVIKDNIFAGKRLLFYYGNDSESFIRRGRDGFYGDWLNVSDVTEPDVVATLYYAYAAKLMSEMCAVIGDSDEVCYADLYENIKAAFRKEFILQNGKIRSDTQSAYVMAFSFGIISSDEARDNLYRKIHERNGHLSTGFLGIRHLLPTLCELGMSDTAYDILTQTDFPGWGYSIVNGATTIWEHWDSNSTEKLTEMNSFNHYSLGSCVEWMYEYCLGLRPNERSGGFKKLTIRPYMDLSGKITSAEGYYNSPFGKITLSWKKSGEKYIFEAEIPCEIEVTYDFVGFDEHDRSISGNVTTFVLKQSEKQE